MDATTDDAPSLSDRPRLDARRPVALVVGVIATVLFVGLRFAVELSGSAPLPWDQAWDDAMSALANPVGVIVAWVPAIVGGTIGMIVIGVGTSLVFLLRRRPWDALNVAASIALVVLIGAPLAAVIARARPTDSLAETVATSFPSGHTAVATTIVVTLGLILRRRGVWVAGAVWVVLMMWSRTYLHAHWASDVVAGMLEGVAVATLVWALIEVWRVRRAQRPDRSGGASANVPA
ncbi:phosphatase PAP2 family protein [uncultured Microbacterium sp.]|uniref:phosphatase PAP2 family protein n=1 Tax=uncultured Microbacterium sp. TaxID=191216 RepID=UPI0025FF7149|nr:phosphatase PAP2 family protein [uncultured Microbacterium sp.]